MKRILLIILVGFLYGQVEVEGMDDWRINSENFWEKANKEIYEDFKIQMLMLEQDLLRQEVEDAMSNKLTVRHAADYATGQASIEEAIIEIVNSIVSLRTNITEIVECLVLSAKIDSLNILSETTMRQIIDSQLEGKIEQLKKGIEELEEAKELRGEITMRQIVNKRLEGRIERLEKKVERLE